MPRRKKKRSRQKVTDFKKPEENGNIQMGYLQRGQYISNPPDYYFQETNEPLESPNTRYQTFYPSFTWTPLENEWYQFNSLPTNQFPLWTQTTPFNAVVPISTFTSYPYQSNYLYQPQTVNPDLVHHVANPDLYSLPFTPIQSMPIINAECCANQPYSNPFSEAITSIEVHQYYEVTNNDNEKSEIEKECEEKVEKSNEDKKVYDSKEGYLVEEPASEKDESEEE